MPVNSFVPTQAPTLGQTPTGAGLMAANQATTNAFQMPLLQQKLAEQTGIAQSATGLGQQEMAKGALSQQMVQAQLGLAQQHAAIAAQHTQQAAIATNVASKTMNAHIAAQQALTAQQQQKASLAAEVTKMYPGLTNAQKVQMVSGMQSALLAHPVQRVAGVAQPAQNATASVLNGSTNSNESVLMPGNNGTPTNQNNLFMNSDQMKSFYSNPKISAKQKTSTLQKQVENTYDYNHGTGSFGKLPNHEKNIFMKQFASKHGIQ